MKEQVINFSNEKINFKSKKINDFTERFIDTNMYTVNREMVT